MEPLTSRPPGRRKLSNAVLDRQLDLFGAPVVIDGSGVRCDAPRPAIACDVLDDASLIAMVPDAGMRDGPALAIEAARRKLSTAIPALEALCRRFSGFGTDRVVLEQAAALDSLVTIG